MNAERVRNRHDRVERRVRLSRLDVADESVRAIRLHGKLALVQTFLLAVEFHIQPKIFKIITHGFTVIEKNLKISTDIKNKNRYTYKYEE